MKQTFIKPKDEKIEKYIKDLEKGLGAVLIAETSGSDVNGYVNTKQDGEKVIVEVVLYEKNEPANYKEGTYNNKPWHTGHKTSFKKAKNIKKLGEEPMI